MRGVFTSASEHGSLFWGVGGGARRIGRGISFCGNVPHLWSSLFGVKVEVRARRHISTSTLFSVCEGRTTAHLPFHIMGGAHLFKRLFYPCQSRHSHTHPRPRAHTHKHTQETPPFEDSSNWHLDPAFTGAASRGGRGEGGGNQARGGAGGAGGAADGAWQQPAGYVGLRTDRASTSHVLLRAVFSFQLIILVYYVERCICCSLRRFRYTAFAE